MQATEDFGLVPFMCVPASHKPLPPPNPGEPRVHISTLLQLITTMHAAPSMRKRN